MDTKYDEREIDANLARLRRAAEGRPMSARDWGVTILSRDCYFIGTSEGLDRTSETDEREAAEMYNEVRGILQ